MRSIQRKRIKMNPIWAIFFKDRFKTPFSLFRMSLAEIIFLLAVTIGAGIGIAEGLDRLLDL